MHARHTSLCRYLLSGCVLVPTALFSSSIVFSQQLARVVPDVNEPGLSAALRPVSLPDSPGAVGASASSSNSPDRLTEQMAGQRTGSQPSLNPQQPLAVPVLPRATDMTIAPGQAGPKQTVRDKMVGSVRDAVSPFSLAGEVISAGYSHVVDSSPNYGTDGTAFGKRIGASIARGTSQNIFSEGVMASLLREDPRYYQLGSKQPFVKRAVYAATRTIVTRTDGGRSTPNFALISAYLGAAALSQTYYPQRNQGISNVMQTWGTGVGGAALGYEVSEFLPDVLQFVHLKKVRHP